MDPFSLIGMVLSYTPIVDVFINGFGSANTGIVALDTAAVGYDVGQLIMGLHLLAKGLKIASLKTPWKWDDGPAKAFVGYTTTAMELVSKYMGAHTSEND